MARNLDTILKRWLLRVPPWRVKGDPGPLDGIPVGHSRVKMINSVKSGENEYDAGEEYWIPSEVADTWLIRGYCDGALSREYEPEYIEAVKAGVQVVKFGG